MADPYSEGSSTLDDILDAGLTGLGYVGGILDKPGRAVRGLLSGRPREALSVIPLSDTLGLTKPSQAVSGVDLLKTYGVEEADPFGEGTAGVAGLAAELVLDPSNFLTPGATKAAQAVNRSKSAVRSADDVVKGAMTRMPEGRVGRKAGFERSASQIERDVEKRLFGSGDVMGDFDPRQLYTGEGSLAGPLVEDAVKAATGEPLKVRRSTVLDEFNDALAPRYVDPSTKFTPKSFAELNDPANANRMVTPGNYVFSDFQGGGTRFNVPDPVGVFNDVDGAMEYVQNLNQSGFRLRDVPNTEPATSLQQGITATATPFGLFTGGRRFDLTAGDNAVSRGLKAAEDFIDPYVDSAARFAKNNPASRYALSLLNDATEGIRTEKGQEAARRAFAERQALDAEARGAIERLRQQQAANPVLSSIPDAVRNDIAVAFAERPEASLYRPPASAAEYADQLSKRPPIGTPEQREGMASRLDQLAGSLAGLDEAIPLIGEQAELLRAIRDDSLARNRGVGVTAKELEDQFVEYAARQRLLLPREEGEGVFGRFRRSADNALRKRPDSQKERSDAFRGVPGGMRQIEDLIGDINVGGPQRKIQASPSDQMNPKAIDDARLEAEDYIFKKLTEDDKTYRQAIADASARLEQASKADPAIALARDLSSPEMGGLFDPSMAPRDAGIVDAADPTLASAPSLGGLFDPSVAPEIPPPPAPMSRSATQVGVPETPQPRVTYVVPTDAIKADPERFQYKRGADTRGSVESLKGVKQYDPDIASGPMDVWRDPATGEDFVVNGHNRLAKAKDTGYPEVEVRYIDVKTAKEAKAFGALKNIADGKGTSIDAATFFRESGLTADEIAQAGVVSLESRIAKEGMILANLDENIFNRVASGEMPDSVGLMIGKYIPQKDVQLQFVRKLLLDKKKYPVGVIEQMAQDASNSPLFNTRVRNLFDDDVQTISSFVEKGELRNYIRNQMGQDANDFKALASERRAGSTAEAGNVLNVSENQRIAMENAEVKEYFDKLVNSKGEVSDVVNQFVERYVAAKPAERDAIRKEAYKAVRDTILRIKSGGEEFGPQGVSGVGDAAARTAAPVDSLMQRAIDAQISEGKRAAPVGDDLFAGNIPPAAPPAQSAGSASSIMVDGKPFQLSKSIKELADDFHNNPDNRLFSRSNLDQVVSSTDNFGMFADEQALKQGKLTPKDEAKLAAYIEAYQRAGKNLDNLTMSKTGVTGAAVPSAPAVQPPRPAGASVSPAPLDEGPLSASAIPPRIDPASVRAAERLASQEGLDKVSPTKLAQAIKDIGSQGFNQETMDAVNEILDIQFLGQKAKELRPVVAERSLAETQAGLFDKDPLRTTETYVRRNNQAFAGVNAAVEMMAGAVRKVGANEFEGKAAKFVPLKQLAAEIGGDSSVIRDRVMQLAKTGENSRFLGVPVEIAEDAKKVARAWKSPEELRPIIGAYQESLRMFKEYVTFPFPAFLTRNFMSELFNSWREDKLSTESLRYTRDFNAGRPIGELPGMPQGLDEAGRRQWLGEQIYKYRISDKASLQTADTTKEGLVPPNQRPVGPASQMGPGWLGFARGELGKAVEAAGAVEGSKANPVKAFARWKEGMKALSSEADAFAREAHFVEALRQGFSPADAAASVHRVHADYSRLSGFERGVMKNLVPFYSFSRLNLPPLLEDLATNPRLRSVIRATTSESLAGGDYVPSWIAENTQIAIPGGEEGRQRYIMALGLPFEDVGVKALGSVASGQFQRAGQQLASSLSPYVQFPIQEITGKQLFSGRSLSDVKPSALVSSIGEPIESLLGVDLPLNLAGRIVASSPLGRFQTTGNRLLDERRGTLQNATSLLTGLNIADVDLNYEKQKDIQRMLEDRLRESGSVRSSERLYIPDYAKGTLSPIEESLFQRYKEIEAQKRATSKERKKAEEAKAASK